VAVLGRLRPFGGGERRRGHRTVMEPLAVATISSIAGAAVLAALIGAVSGAVVWRVRHGLVLGGFLSIGAYLLVLVIDGGFSLRGAAVFGGPPLVLTFLVSYLAARHL